MKHAKALLAGIFAALAAPATPAQAHRYPQLASSDLQRIRGDVAKVGDSFNTVIAREYRQKANSGKV
jgi:hypothetical protein